MKSIAYEWAYHYALLLRLDSPVLRDHDRGFCEHAPYPREGVVIIAATRGQHYLGDNGLGTVPTRRGPGRPSGRVRAPRQSMPPGARVGHRLARHHLVVYTWMDPNGVRGSH